MSTPSPHLPSPTPRFLTVGDVTLHVRREGITTGLPPIVFLNSLGSDLRIWDDVVPAALRQHPVVRYDKRGHGLSDSPAGPSSIADHSRDLLGLLDALGVEKAVLVGVSVGGMIALDFASRHPERTAGLLLCDTGARIGSAEMWEARIADVWREGLGAIADRILSRWFTPEFFETRPDDVRGCRNMLTRTPAEGYTATCEAIRDADLREAARSVRVPVTVLCGDTDLSTPPEVGRELAELLGAPFHLIGDCGHLPCVERPAETARHLLAFLDSLSASSEDRYERGMRVRRSVLGDAHVDRATAGITDLDRDFQTFITEYAWGGPWSRGHFDTRTRHLITLAVLAALPREHELAMHLRATANTGVDEADLRELFLHVAIYAGVPVANRALQLAKQALNERSDP
ncbi:3-oxoadipate enol-lactonase [Deinococcus sp. YIM 134068]|uniref:bifunctional 3-oxoadipate enol-lactonase/4-carboxymuconolactone decarboxylase PcaDC n=1 Tax=Deinococcus lichenicola TaxID=3118910 RepID=UPI002F950D9F